MGVAIVEGFGKGGIGQYRAGNGWKGGNFGPGPGSGHHRKARGTERAAKIAENGAGTLGKLMFADMGVFQITAENSSEEYEWGGSFNTSSRRKTASVTIRLKYKID